MAKLIELESRMGGMGIDCVGMAMAGMGMHKSSPTR